MTTANLTVIGNVLFKRGNTTVASAYTGVPGEIIIDTTVKTIRVQDGSTAGGTRLATYTELGTQSTLANANAATQTTEINSLRANITAANAAITSLQSNAAIQATLLDTLTGNAATQATSLVLVNANITAANSAIQALSANIGTLVAGAPGALDTLIELGNALGNNASFSATVVNWLGNITSNVTAANARITTLDANLGTATTNITTLFTNAATQATGITTLDANLGAYQTWANGRVTTLDANLGTATTNITTLFSNAATQAGNITTLQTQVYANANVAEYLPTYSGNVRAEYVIMSFGGIITTGASPAPSISGFSSISTAGNAPNEGNISASGNLVANRGAYITGNVTAGNLTITGNLDQPNRGFGNGPGTNLYITAGHTQGCSIPGGNTIISGGLGYNGIAWNGGNVTLRTGDYYSNQWNFDYAGNLKFPTNNLTITPKSVAFSNAAVVSSANNLITLSTGVNGGTSSLWVEDYANIGTSNIAAVYANPTVGSKLVRIAVGQNGSPGPSLWDFDATGNLTLPAGGVIAEGGGLSGAIRLTPAGGANANQALLIYPTGTAEGDHVHLTAGGGSTELYLGNDLHYVKLVDGGNVELRAATANLSAQAAWTFDTTGNIDTIRTLGIKVPDGVPTDVAVINSTSGQWHLNPLSNLATTGGTGTGLTVNVTETGQGASAIAIATAGTGYTNGDLITVTSGTSNATFTIVIGGRNTWRFDQNARLTLPGSLALPNGAVIRDTANNAVAFGNAAGQTSQGQAAVSIGWSAGGNTQGTAAVAVGVSAGQTTQGQFAVAIGGAAGSVSQGTNAVAIGYGAGYELQGNNSIIINATGAQLNQTTANTFTVAPVRNDVANVTSVMFYNTTSKEVTYGNTISVAGNITAGNVAGETLTGNLAGRVLTATQSGITSLGTLTNINTNGNANVALTVYSATVVATGNITAANIISPNYLFANGVNILSAVGAYQTFANANAATQATSINTINNTLTSANVGIGYGAGAENQGTSAVAIGEGAGSLDQGLSSVAIGNDAGAQYQGDRSVAVGAGAGKTNQGDYAVAIGRNAGFTNQGNNSIIINATSGTLNQTTANTFTVAPVRNDVANVAQVLFYNTTSKEITYGNTISIAGNINASQFNFANGVNILTTVAGTYANANVAEYLPTYSGNVRALNFVGAVQAQVGSSFAYATDAFGSLYNTGQVFLPADVNSNAVVAGYTIVGNSGAVTLTVTSATFVAGSPNFVQVATTPTASSFAYPVTVYSADYVAALSNSSLTVGNATISGNVTAPRYLFANGVNILSTVAGTYGNANVTSYFQSLTSLALGSGAGATAQGVGSVALGVNAGNDQGYYAVAIGIGSGRVAQADSAVAIGGEAGWVSQGINSVAVGYRAGTTNQANSSIILNATGANLNATTANTFTVAPVRNDVANVAQVLFYNTTSNEITYGNTISIAGNLSVAGNVVQQSAYYETYANVTNSGGNLTCNFVNGSTFYATLTANVTVNFTNVVATAGRVTGATLIVDQGATAYRVANIQINSGGIQTVKYAGGTPNTGTASNTDVMSFSLISLDGTNWRVLGQISNYG